MKRISDKRRKSGVALGHNSTIARGKPKPKPSKRPTGVKRDASEARSMLAGLVASRKAPSKLPDRGVAKRDRSAEKFERAYGSESRVLWIQSLHSVVSGLDRSWPDKRCVNAHVRVAGKGVKAGPEWIVPLRFDEEREKHQHGQKTFEKKYGIDLDLAAQQIEGIWSGTMKCPRCGHGVMRTPTPRGVFACSDFLDCGWGLRWNEIGRISPA